MHYNWMQFGCNPRTQPLPTLTCNQWSFIIIFVIVVNDRGEWVCNCWSCFCSLETQHRCIWSRIGVSCRGKYYVWLPNTRNWMKCSTGRGNRIDILNEIKQTKKIEYNLAATRTTSITRWWVTGCEFDWMSELSQLHPTEIQLDFWMRSLRCN